MIEPLDSVPADLRWPRLRSMEGWGWRLPLAIAFACALHGAITAVLLVEERLAPVVTGPAEPIAVEVIQEPAPPEPEAKPEAPPPAPTPAAKAAVAAPVNEAAKSPEADPPQPSDPPPPTEEVAAKKGPSDVGPSPQPEPQPQSPQLRAALPPAEQAPPDRAPPPPPPDPDGLVPPQSEAANEKQLPRAPLFTIPATIVTPLQQALGRPLAEEGSADGDDYKGTVFGLLEQVKQYPDAAKRRQESGIAIITFAIDDVGQPQRVALVRSSGHAALDREALDMVRRAAPFPPPPPKAPRQFGPAITFSLR